MSKNMSNNSRRDVSHNVDKTKGFIFDEFLKERMERGIGAVDLNLRGIPLELESVFCRTFEDYPIDQISFYQVETIFDERTAKNIVRLRFVFAHKGSNTSFQLIMNRKPVQEISDETYFDYILEPFLTVDELEDLFNHGI